MNALILVGTLTLTLVRRWKTDDLLDSLFRLP